MTATPLSFIDDFRERRVLVVGEAMLDAYLRGTSRRLCQEAPVPIVSVEARDLTPGGAANTAANVVALGGQAELVSAVGDDAEADSLLAAIDGTSAGRSGVVRVPGRSTLAKQRVMAGSQLVVRFDQGTTTDIPQWAEDRLVDELRSRWRDCDVVAISDYAYGVLTPRVLAAMARLQEYSSRVVVVDAKDLRRFRGLGVTAVKPNLGQALEFLEPADNGGGRVEQAERAAERVLDATGAHIVALTMDVDGAIVVERGRSSYRTYARPASNIGSAGAGDTFVAALSLALASGAHTPAAAELASRAAARVVEKPRTSTCSAPELRASFSTGDKILEGGRVEETAGLLRRQGSRIVFTNGCFDILHRGHITYLNRAKALGDVLIVGVNSDASVARLKGPSRPINTLEDRVEVLAALSSVDHVVAFDEDTPEQLIETIKPDVFAKGGDYTIEMLPEASVVEANGGAVQILPFVEDRSTSGIIDRIRTTTTASEFAG